MKFGYKWFVSTQVPARSSVCMSEYIYIYRDIYTYIYLVYKTKCTYSIRHKKLETLSLYLHLVVDIIQLQRNKKT